MSEFKAPTPLADGFVIGDAIDTHNGVACYPAIHAASKERFILKWISIPESQAQIDALLLTGACPDEDAVREYYQNVTEELRQEIELQQEIARLPGFAPIYGYQIEPKEDAIGYDVYILSTYKTTLAAYVKRNTLTHLNGVNLGIDLAAALAACHGAGYLYQALKPENVFINQQRQFQIGDLGFTPLEGLSYATFPDKYISACTAPEVQDFMGSVNPTIDIYSLGMVLYWIFNGCRYPFEEESTPEEAMQRRLSGEDLLPPAYADYELAAIILKACAFHPEDRWLTPGEMEQALTAYMQRNAVNDSLIGPPILSDPVPEEALSETLPAEVDAPEEEQPDQSAPGEEDVDEAAAVQNAETAEILEKANQVLGQESATEPVEVPPEEDAAPEAPAEPEQEPPAESSPEPEEQETAEERKARKKAEKEADQKAAQEDREARKAAEIANGKTKDRKWITPAILALVACLVAGAVYAGYALWYCIGVADLKAVELDGTSMRVSFATKAPEESLRVVCTDTYGNVRRAEPQDGVADFTDLLPGTQYTVTLEIQGFHKLTGTTVTTYTTEQVAKVVSLSAVTGGEDGSVIISFTTDGPESNPWTIFYQAEGQAQQETFVSGHSGTVSDLEVGVSYEFRIADKNGNLLQGDNSLTHTVTPVLLAQDITLSDCTGTELTVSWAQPEQPPEHWSVRCYNLDNNYSVSQEVSQCIATFTELDPAVEYTVEVTAAGMTRGASVTLSANPLTITDAQCAVNEQGNLVLNWSFTGNTPSGWRVTCTPGTDPERAVVKALEEPGFVLEAPVPGAHYDIVIESADNGSVFGGQIGYDMPAAADFTDFNVSPGSMQLFLIATPEKEGWQSRWINSSSQTSFVYGPSYSFVLMAPRNYWAGSTEYNAVYLLKDSQGNVVDVTTETVSWANMWQQRHFTGTLADPGQPGEYTLEIYFNCRFVKSCTFTLTQPASN